MSSKPARRSNSLSIMRARSSKSLKRVFLIAGMKYVESPNTDFLVFRRVEDLLLLIGLEIGRRVIVVVVIMAIDLVLALSVIGRNGFTLLSVDLTPINFSTL